MSFILSIVCFSCLMSHVRPCIKPSLPLLARPRGLNENAVARDGEASHPSMGNRPKKPKCTITAFTEENDIDLLHKALAAKRSQIEHIKSMLHQHQSVVDSLRGHIEELKSHHDTAIETLAKKHSIELEAIQSKLGESVNNLIGELENICQCNPEAPEKLNSEPISKKEAHQSQTALLEIANSMISTVQLSQQQRGNLHEQAQSQKASFDVTTMTEKKIAEAMSDAEVYEHMKKCGVWPTTSHHVKNFTKDPFFHELRTRKTALFHHTSSRGVKRMCALCSTNSDCKRQPHSFCSSCLVPLCTTIIKGESNKSCHELWHEADNLKAACEEQRGALIEFKRKQSEMNKVTNQDAGARTDDLKFR